MSEQKMIVTALLHPVFVDVLHQRAVFIALAFVSWASYLGVRAWREANLPTELGFRKQRLAPAFAATSLFSAAAQVVMAMIAHAQHSLVFRWQMLVLLALYPV